MYAIGFRYYFTPLPGYFSPFPHGTCPLSVTKEYLGLADGPARFKRNFRGSALLGDTLKSGKLTSTGVLPSLLWPSQHTSTSLTISNSSTVQQHGPRDPTTPQLQRLSAITQLRFGLFRFRSPLLTESQLFSLPVGTEMFHFPTFPPTALYIQAEVAGHNSGTFKVSLFGNPRITVWLPTPRGLSQVPTSFIGSWCLGIHRLHLVACLLTTKMLASTVKFSKNERAHHQHQPPTNDQARQMVRKKAPPTGNRPFRTQQRANKPPQHFPLPHHTRRRLYSRGTTLSQCSTNQNPPAGNTRPGTEVNKQTNHTGQPAKSSLERR